MSNFEHSGIDKSYYFNFNNIIEPNMRIDFVSIVIACLLVIYPVG